MQIESIEGMALVRMNTGKANAMSVEFLERLGALLDTAGDARAIVLTGYDRFFSAGLDLPPLLALDRATLGSFIELFSDIMLRVFTLTVPVVAAVNGHAVAGGCVLALQADHRIMVEQGGKIGLTEVQLGIGLPAQVIECLRFQVPAWALRPIALEGTLMASDEAMRHGLVDERVPADVLEARALDRARTLASIPPLAFAQVKGVLRRPTVETIAATRAQENARWLDTWFSGEAQKRLHATVARLSGG